MKLRRLILLLALVSVPFLQNVSIAQGDETKIIALENLWNQMQINHDADAMGKMLDSHGLRWHSLQQGPIPGDHPRQVHSSHD